MEPQSPTTLVLCGKPTEETEVARCLKTGNTLKLPDGSPVNVVLRSEIGNRESIGDDDVFLINSYMDFLSTSRFGKLLIYSPKLASTHDVVSEPVEECMGITKGMPYVFVHDTDGGWTSNATCAVCCLFGYDRCN